MGIGQNIKARRKQLRISAETIAEKLGMAPSTIYRYEKGDIEKVDSAILIGIADILRTTPAALMGWTDTSDPESGIITPDIDTAAMKAAETILRYKVNAAPVSPMTILKSMPNVFVVSFTELAKTSGIDANSLAMMYDSESQDVVTITKEVRGERRYIVAYNQRMPFYMIHRAMARELGHILLGHDCTHPSDTQTTEALYFLRHLLCPRPLIKALQDVGITLSVETVGSLTGCYGRTIAGMRETPGAHIKASVNRRIKDQFADYIRNILEYRFITATRADSTPADFGTYMDNYEE